MSTHYTTLASQGALLLEGPDADVFLQGQTTCDLDELNAGHSITGAYCTPQGRMVCDFRLLHCDENVRLLGMHQSLCEESAAVFGKYIVFSKAEISVASSQFRQFGLWGTTASSLFDQDPGGRNHCWQAGDAFWVQVDETGQRFQAWVPAGKAAELENWLDSHSQAAAEEDWQLLEINQGLGHLEAETAGMFIPQMLNFQHTGQVSFSKGCYTGQEVVARMHYRGKLKRPMYLASVPGETIPAAGLPLFKPGSEQSVGNVVNAAPDGAGFKLLAVVASDAIDAGVHLGGPEGPPLEFHPLPYSLSAE